MSILDDDFEEKVDDVVDSLFYRVRGLGHVSNNLRGRGHKDSLFFRMGDAIGPFEIKADENGLNPHVITVFTKGEIIKKLNEPEIINEFGVKKIEDLLIRPRRAYILAESRNGGFIDVTYYVRIRSGAILRHEVSYEYE